eukprot:TRINITY_DN1018_c0_g5_i1.p1 TRINITY_DN1018_c0_g5~~TRINITY_DN1018_c0_g5_i1.p1  ORF type:complete len:168 (-),score=51.09 TRINITY_DN1018_c0_g5_i1:444-947(-)
MVGYSEDFFIRNWDRYYGPGNNCGNQCKPPPPPKKEEPKKEEKKEEPKKEEKKEEPKKEDPPKPKPIQLKVPICCQKCVKDITTVLRQIGIMNVAIDVYGRKVTVVGPGLKPDDVLKAIKKVKKTAELIPEPPPPPKKEEKKADDKKADDKKGDDKKGDDKKGDAKK